MQGHLVNGKRKAEDCPAGDVVAHGDLAAVGADDRAAERQPEAETAAAVDDAGAAGVEHVKDVGLVGIGNAGAVVGDLGGQKTAGGGGGNGDLRPRRRVFDGVVDEVDEHLNNQMRVHAHQHQIVGSGDADAVLAAAAADVAQSLGNGLVHQLRHRPQLHRAVLNAGDREQIFHQTDEPLGVVVNVLVQLALFVRRDRLAVFQQHAGAARNRGQRRAQVV